MSFFKGILTDLRQRRLWPVPLALIAAIVAVPVVLAKSPQAQSPTPLPSSPTPSSGTPVAAVSLGNDPSTHVTGKARDPFTQQVIPTKVTTSVSSALGGSSTATVTGGVTPSTAGTSVGSTGTTSVFSGSVSNGASSGAQSSSSIPSTSPVSPVPVNAKPTPAPSGLAADQSYRVALSVSTPDGSVDAIDPLVRLSPVPSTRQPLVVELGVLQGGNRVLFAVQPGTKVSGAGACITGPIDCEIISLRQDQVETASAGSTSVQFAVTAVTAETHPNAAAADVARQAVSAAGSHLIANSQLNALSLFQYQPQVGVLVDLRNLTVGGN